MTTTPIRPLHHKPLTSLERATLRLMPPAAKEPTINLSIEMARAKGDSEATAKLLAAIEAGARSL